MTIGDIATARSKLIELQQVPISDRTGVEQVALDAFSLLDRFPALLTDAETRSALRSLTQGLYARKRHLPRDLRMRLTQIFQECHGLAPTVVTGLLKNNQPVSEVLATHKEAQALLRGRQRYPVPVNVLARETLPCSEYFKSLLIKLADGAEVRISRGLLAHHSEMARVMLRQTNMRPATELSLDMIDRHQFDVLVAFLSTGQRSLIHHDNVVALMQAADYLRIPHLVEACRGYVHRHVDFEELVTFINISKQFNLGVLTMDLENRLSEHIKQELSKPKPTEEFLSQLSEYRDQLKEPIDLELSNSDISLEKLALLKELPIRRLAIQACPLLNADCFEVIAQMPHLSELNLSLNNWVDDAALEQLPSHVRLLEIDGCKAFGGKGLASLSKSNVTDLSLFGCTQLKDADLAQLPTQLERLNLRNQTDVGKESAKRFAELSALKYLCLAHATLSDGVLSALPRTLEDLDASGCSSQEAVLDSVQHLSALRRLFISGLAVQDEELASIPQTIQILGLSRCTKITDGGLKLLSKKPALKSVVLHSCPNVTEEGVAQFGAEVEVGWQAPSITRQLYRALAK